MELSPHTEPVCRDDSAVTVPTLHVGYEMSAASVVLAEPTVLAAIGFGGSATTSPDPRYLRVALEPVDTPSPLEIWRSRNHVERGRDGDIAWATDGDYSFGAIELDEAVHGGIATTTHHAYRTLSTWCRASATPHLLRIWNYLDAINLGAGDDERYRQFCHGRAAGLNPTATIENAGAYPAATAIGVRDGRRVVQVYWLAARQAGRPLENPRQLSAWRYPRQYGPTAPGFTRAMRAPTHSPQLYISGTAAIVGHASHHPGDCAAQFMETLANLDSLLASTRTDNSHRFGTHSTLKVYVRHAADISILRTLLRTRMDIATPLLLLHGDICRAELLLEIDGVHNG